MRLRNGDAEQAELGHRPVDLVGKALVAVEVGGHRSDGLVGEAPCHRSDVAMGLAQRHPDRPLGVPAGGRLPDK